MRSAEAAIREAKNVRLDLPCIGNWGRDGDHL